MAQPFLASLRRASRVFAVGVAAATVVLAASCRDVVTDDVTDAGAALCGSFEACAVEERACDRVNAFFAREDDAVFEDYLAYYQEWSCGEGCGSVEVCLDFPPMCASKGRSCSSDFDCCNASTGAAACRDGGCCFDLGVLCLDDADCCPLENGVAVSCRPSRDDGPETCGGFAQCALRDEACETSDDCCGKAACSGDVCVVDTCVERDAPCRADEKCCVAGDRCRDGVCAPKPDECAANPQTPPCCTEANAPCVVGGTPCCGGALCTVTLTGETLCGGDDCEPLGSDCSTDNCCTNGSDDIRCLGVGSDDTGQRICQAIDCQLTLGLPCSVDLPCCAGLKCLPTEEADGNTCQEACDPGNCHDLRSFGPPIDLASDGCTLSAEEAECVTAICEEDNFCCCVWWDEDCIDAADARCPGQDQNEG